MLFGGPLAAADNSMSGSSRRAYAAYLHAIVHL